MTDRARALIVGHDVVERERGDDGMAGRELVLEPSISQLVAADVISTSCRGDLEHVGIDVDEHDANGRERIEDRGGETSVRLRGQRRGLRAGHGRRASGRRSQACVVVRDELADCPVVVVGGNAEVTGDAVLLSHRLRIRPQGFIAARIFGGTLLGASNRDVAIPRPPRLTRSQATTQIGLARDDHVREQALREVERTRRPRRLEHRERCREAPSPSGL